MARGDRSGGARKRGTKAGAAGSDAPASDDPRLLRARKLCERRSQRDVDFGIGAIIADVARTARRAADSSATAAEAWEREMSRGLVEETWIESVTPALMLVGVPSAAVAYAVDRELRGGALARIRAALRAPGLRVRTRQGRKPTLPQ